MRYLILAQILLSTCAAFASEIGPSCELAKGSILSRSSSGLPQVSNLGIIRITCRVPQRPFPTKPGEFRPGLRAETTAYEISTIGTKKLIPSEAKIIGGGAFGPAPEPESVIFYVQIPLDSEQLDTEARRSLAMLELSMTPEQKAQFDEVSRKKALENLRQLVSQHRVGHFQVECRILDGTRVMGVDIVELEALFKVRFSDFVLPAFPPA